MSCLSPLIGIVDSTGVPIDGKKKVSFCNFPDPRYDRYRPLGNMMSYSYLNNSPGGRSPQAKADSLDSLRMANAQHFSPFPNAKHRLVLIKCSKCIGCRLKHASDWSLRCQHELRSHKRSCFLTLTYDNEHLPKDRSLCIKHFQNFMKRLRKHIAGSSAAGVRYFACGEYGDKYSRPHYHVLLFGYDFDDDKVQYYKTNSKTPIYTSGLLRKLWFHGLNVIGTATQQSAGYIARYTTKKVFKKDYPKGVKPEFITMSRRPGIGYNFFFKYFKDMFPRDYLTVDGGKKIGVPFYYFRMLKRCFPELHAEVYANRLVRSIASHFDPHIFRSLYARGVDLLSRMASKCLPRVYENS